MCLCIFVDEWVLVQQIQPDRHLSGSFSVQLYLRFENSKKEMVAETEKHMQI